MFQIRLQAAGLKLKTSQEQRRFSLAERRDNLRVIASPDARLGSLRLHVDALLCSAVLSSGQHVVHALGEERSAWLHVVQGEITLGNARLTTGDGAAVTSARSVSFTAVGEAELLLVELPGPSMNSGSPSK